MSAARNARLRAEKKIKKLIAKLSPAEVAELENKLKGEANEPRP